MCVPVGDDLFVLKVRQESQLLVVAAVHLNVLEEVGQFQAKKRRRREEIFSKES
jgi:hypothetical protein